jgi:hypothetical protein
MNWTEEDLANYQKNHPELMKTATATPNSTMTSLVVKNKPSKYRATLTEYRGVKYHSKKEAKFAESLDAREHIGQIKYYLRQVPIQLPGTRYLVDFLVFYADGDVEFIDVKGFDTPVSKMKRKQVELLYPIKIQIV